MVDKKENQTKEVKKQSRMDKYGWIAILVFVIAFVAILAWSSTAKDIAEKNYLSSLTPEERLTIAEQERYKELREEQERIEQEIKNEQYWQEFYDGVNSTTRWMIKYPLNPYLAAMFCLLLYCLLSSRWRWWFD